MKKALAALVLCVIAAYGIAGTLSVKESKRVVEKAVHTRLAAAEAGI